MRGSLYLHASALPRSERRHRDAVAAARLSVPDADWNVARVDPDGVGLLLYQDFDEAAFPALLISTKVDHAGGPARRIDHRRSRNPFILHRKELTVPPEDPRCAGWAALTAAMVARGLFREPGRIGRLRRWEELLLAAGLEISGADVRPRR